jgi:hypothetical protein
MSNLPWSFRYYDPTIAIIKESLSEEKLDEL